MKIIVAATPKAGNHWLKAMLGYCYKLPQIDITEVTNVPAMHMKDGDWITHGHFFGTNNLLADFSKAGVTCVGVKRHPFDVLISYFFHTATYSDQRDIFNYLTWDMNLDGEIPGEHLFRYVQNYGFATDLRLSLSFQDLGVPVVAYEDLIANPFRALKAITDQIRPISENSLISAVARTEFSVMKAARFTARAGHLRQGQYGSWKSLLSDEVVGFIKGDRIYCELFARLGYGFDVINVVPFSYTKLPPFYSSTHFENGMPLTDLLKEIYHRHFEPGDLDVVSVGQGSFYEWLSKPTVPDAALTQLGYEIYLIRGDLQEAFPEAFKGDFHNLNAWFKQYGPDECGVPIGMLLNET